MSPDPTPLLRFLDAQHVLHLATLAAGRVHAAPLFYARAAQASLVFMSHPDTGHIRHLLAHPHAAVSVHGESTVHRTRGVQMQGMVRRAPDAGASWLAKFPEAAPAVLASPHHEFWLFEPSWARLIRFDRGVKHNLEWRFGQGETATASTASASTTRGASSSAG